MRHGPTTDCSSMEPCGDGGELNGPGIGRRRDRIERVKLSTASSCLGGAFGATSIALAATRRSPAQGAVEPEAARLSRRPSVSHALADSSPLATENQAAL